MKNYKRQLPIALLSASIFIGSGAAPAIAADSDSSSNATNKKTTVDQQASNSSEVDQDSDMKALPHETFYYSNTNVSYIDQDAENASTTVTETRGTLKSKISIKQDASNTADVEQGTMKALPHSTVYYEGTNVSYIDQDAENTSTTVTETRGTLKSKISIKQDASNTADVEQGTVKALPHSTVYYEGTNVSYIDQDAENTSTTVTETRGTLKSKISIKQDASNTADVEQGTVEKLPHSTVYYGGINKSE